MPYDVVDIFDTWIVERTHLEVDPVAGKPLGRHVEHDSRSKVYAVAEADPATLASVSWTRRTPILDQGNVGSCTGNATVGALGTDPLFATIPTTVTLNEAEALAIYSAAEVIDGDGPYPPNDNGSSGLSVAKAAKNAGLISGFTHALSLAAAQNMLTVGSAICGVSWYDSFDNPDANGHVTITPNAQVRGGHEIELVGMDVAARTFRLANSWSATWGDHGYFTISWADFDRLLAEQGDVTQFVARVPAPPAPTPVPAGADYAALCAVLDPWAIRRHVGQNASAAAAWRNYRTNH